MERLPRNGYVPACMKQSQWKSSQVSRAKAAKQPLVATLKVAGFAPVRFNVPIRRMPGLCSGLRSFTETDRPSEERDGCVVIRKCHDREACSHENSHPAPDQPTPATISRAHTSDGERARRTTLPRCVSAAAADRAGMAHGGRGSGAEARTRRVMNAPRTSAPRVVVSLRRASEFGQ
jgi:hypothetical protein